MSVKFAEVKNRPVEDLLIYFDGLDHGMLVWLLMDQPLIGPFAQHTAIGDGTQSHTPLSGLYFLLKISGSNNHRALICKMA